MTRAPLRASDLAAVALGGAVGAGVRYLLGTWVPDGAGLPWTTFSINVVGAFALGALPLVEVVRRSHRWAVALGPGLLGGFTTVSTWAVQVRGLTAAGDAGVAGLYLGGTVATCLAAAALGRRVSARPEPEDALA